ncbi:MAG: NADP-dependent oxidoreductase [Acidobacteriaceae bacterium]|nr:NADP-dependent oxidoreductase [Acidobacteriaceae bacterium]
MKAIVIHQYGGTEQLKYEDAPDPKLRPGEVLVQMAATSINPVDFKVRSGALQKYMPLELPAILGRDAAGTVKEVGPSVSGFKIGDRVMGLTMAAYAELVAIKAKDLAHVPEGLDILEAAVLPLVTLTGEQLVTHGIKPTAGQTVLVAGAIGGVGRSAVYALKQSGAKVIAGVRAKQMDEAKELGADAVISLEDDAEIKKYAPYDAVADTVGHETAEKLLTLVKPGGTFASVLGEPANRKDHPNVNVVTLRVEEDGPELEELARAVVAGKLSIPIGKRLPLEQMAEAHRLAEKGGIGKVLVTIAPR